MKLSLFCFFLVFLLSLLVERHGFGGEDLLLLMSRGQNDVTWYCSFPQRGILGFLMAWQNRTNHIFSVNKNDASMQFWPVFATSKDHDFNILIFVQGDFFSYLILYLIYNTFALLTTCSAFLRGVCMSHVGWHVVLSTSPIDHSKERPRINRFVGSIQKAFDSVKLTPYKVHCSPEIQIIRFLNQITFKRILISSPLTENITQITQALTLVMYQDWNNWNIVETTKHLFRQQRQRYVI